MWILYVLLFILLGSYAYAAYKGAPWVPTWKADINRLDALLKLKGGETVYELGCGDGRVISSLAKNHDIRGIGIELSLLQFLVASIRNIRRPNLSIRLHDIFSVNLSDADVIYMFLMPETYAKIKSKLERELKPGTRVVTYVWPIPEWIPDHVDATEKKPNLYTYIR